MVKCVFDCKTVARAQRLVPLVQGLVSKLREEAAQLAGGLVSHFDLGMGDVLEGLKMCQMYLELVAVGELAPGPSVGRGLMQEGIILRQRDDGVALWVTQADQVTRQNQNETPLALMTFVEGYLKENDIFIGGGWGGGHQLGTCGVGDAPASSAQVRCKGCQGRSSPNRPSSRWQTATAV